MTPLEHSSVAVAIPNPRSGEPPPKRVEPLRVQNGMGASRSMPAKGRDIIVIGTSAGGLEALESLVSQLETDLPSAIFIVQHMAPENTGAALLHRLGRHKAFRCALAIDGEKIQ